MPRVSKHPVVYLALSPAATATALGIRPERVRDAIEKGEISIRQIGAKKRLLVSDIETWVRSWRQPTKRQSRRKVLSDAR
ncbi:MAG TPA: helix-turn-helix domain-containing protein [Bradyrhizobium sp.]|uniref:helix-turn-helix domain-containing protein n=1 Tax=Bradyrhizobium sp. TaxID=376 RepID=UPI002BE17955|nr:helix-turn-helix domain-containing protein [Bradyrhizobium sp.]HLZ06268.1 helix-turn-helix domain-containing protein [Bradyrhizobium sp.]